MRKFSKLLAATLILTTVASPVQASSTAYSDLDKAASWAQSAIVKAKELGLMTGDPNGNFRPLDTITRQEAAAILVKLMKLDTTGITANSFADVDTSDWGFKQIEAVKRAGLMVGDYNKFRPNDNVTREELALTLIKALGIDSTGKGANLTFADKDSISGWAKDAVAAAVEARLMSGDGTNFNPQQPAMRQEVAVVIVNFASAAAPQAAVIEKVANGTVTIGGVTYTAADSVKGLFAEGNQAILSNAKIKFNAEDNKINSVTYLELTASGQAAETGKPEFSGNLVLDGGAVVIDGNMKISGNFISLKNVTINGDLEIGKELQNDFYSDKVTVKGKTIVNGGDSNTVVFNNARLGAMSVNKPNVRVQPSGSTTVGDMTVNADATIDADPGVTIPHLTVGEGAGTVHLNANITGLMVNGSQPMTLGGTGSIGQMTVTNPNARLTLQDGLRFNGITLPNGSTPTGIIANYEQIKSHLPTIKIGDNTIPTPSSNNGGDHHVPTPATPTELARELKFTDLDADYEQISGEISWSAASNENQITQYVVYFLDNTNKRIGEAIGTVNKGQTYSINLAANTPVPNGATQIGVFSKNGSVLSATAARIMLHDAPLSEDPTHDKVMVLNYDTGSDEVYVSAPFGSKVKIYNAETDGQVIGDGIAEQFGPDVANFAAQLKQEEPEVMYGVARVTVGKGFGDKIYVSTTEFGKSESLRTAVDVPKIPNAPVRTDVQLIPTEQGDYQLHVDNVPEHMTVMVYKSTDERLPFLFFMRPNGPTDGSVDIPVASECVEGGHAFVAFLNYEAAQGMEAPQAMAESQRVDVEIPLPDAVPSAVPSDPNFNDQNDIAGEIGGYIDFKGVSDEHDITSYVAYFLDQDGHKIGNAIGREYKSSGNIFLKGGKQLVPQPTPELTRFSRFYNLEVPQHTKIPHGATQIGIFSKNGKGESETCTTVEFQDAATAARVTTEQELRSALTNPLIDRIELANDIQTTAALTIDRTVIVDGADYYSLNLSKELTIAASAEGSKIQNIKLNKGISILANDVNVDSVIIQASEFSTGASYGILIGGSEAGGAKGVIIQFTIINNEHADSIGITNDPDYNDVEFNVRYNTISGGATGIYSESATVSAYRNTLVNIQHAIILNQGALIGGDGLQDNRISLPHALNDGTPGDGITLPSTVSDDVAMNVLLSNHFEHMGNSKKVVREDGTEILEKSQIPDEFAIQTVNNEVGADEVHVVGAPVGSTVYVYDASTGGNLLGEGVAQLKPDGSEETYANIVLENGFGAQATVFVSMKEEGKAESNRVNAAVEAAPTAPLAADIAITDSPTGADLIEVGNVNPGDRVVVYTSNTETTPLAEGKNTGASNDTVTIDVADGFAPDVTEIYVAIISKSGAISQRTAITIPATVTINKTNPAVPTTPVNPTTPVDPTTPADPTTPVDPTTSADPATPADPTTPATPVAPANTETTPATPAAGQTTVTP